MHIKTRQNVGGNILTVVEYKNKNYLRIQKNKFSGPDMQPVVEWKKLKTNHLVNADKFKILEENYKKNDNILSLSLHILKQALVQQK